MSLHKKSWKLVTFEREDLNLTPQEGKGCCRVMQARCIRRRIKEESNKLEQIELIPRSRSNNHRRRSPSPSSKSFEQQIYITMTRTAQRSAYFCKGVTSFFISRLVGISQFCAIYSFTGMLFTVSVCPEIYIYRVYRFVVIPFRPCLITPHSQLQLKHSLMMYEQT